MNLQSAFFGVLTLLDVAAIGGNLWFFAVDPEAALKVLNLGAAVICAIAWTMALWSYLDWREAMR